MPVETNPIDVLASGWRTNAVRSRDVQTVHRNGRAYLQFPLVPLTEMVLDYPENGTREYLPAKHISETAGLWDGTLLTYVHPKNRNSTVRDPDAFMGEAIGMFTDPRVLDGGEKLKGTGVIDVAKATDLGGSAAELVELLQNGEQVSVSAGYATMDDEHRPGRFDGEQYDLIQGKIIPDHIAVFPSDSRVQARCSPEDGCAAPRANVYQDGQAVNQRATNGVRANMSETEPESAVDTTEEQRQMTDELFSMLDEVESSGVPSDRQAAELRRLRNVVDGLGQMLERGETDVGPALGAVVRESKAFVADILNDDETTEPTDEKTNAACDCAGICRCNPSTSGSDDAGASLPNMQAVPGKMNREMEPNRGRQREDPDEYPSGGRSNWEKRKLGLDGQEDDDSYPAGGRSAWERRKARQRRNAASESDGVGDESGHPTGSRSSYERRQNATDDVDPQEWLDHEYPLLAKQKAEEREEKRKRWEELREQSKSNYARHTDQ